MFELYTKNLQMTSQECFENALKISSIYTLNDVDDDEKLSKIDFSLFALGLMKAIDENQEGQFLYHRPSLNNKIDDVAKYLCVFSKRAYINVGNIDFFINMDTTSMNGVSGFHERNSSIPNRTIKLYITFRELIRNGIVFFAPSSGYLEYPAFSLWDDSYNFLGPLLSEGYRRIDCSRFSIISEDMVKKMYVGLPWLKNARVEDYIEIANQYQDLFLRYSYQVRKVADATNDINMFQYDLIKDIEEAMADIRISIEKKKEELRVKGIYTAIGIIFTTIPFLFSGTFLNINPEWLTAVMGGGTMYEFFDGISDIKEMLNVSKDNSFFPMWEWNRLTIKNNKEKWTYRELL